MPAACLPPDACGMGWNRLGDGHRPEHSTRGEEQLAVDQQQSGETTGPVSSDGALTLHARHP